MSAPTYPDDLPPLTVRTVTAFLSPDDLHPSRLHHTTNSACKNISAVKHLLLSSAVPVQTTRLSLPSPSCFSSPEEAISAAEQLEKLPVDFISFGTVSHLDTAFHNVHFFERILAVSTKIFISILVAENHQIYPSLCRLAANVVRANAPHENGLRNFRFAVLANVRPQTPFFPSSYASHSAIALGVQATNLMVPHATLEQSCTRLTHAIETAANYLVAVCEPAANVTCDMSLAPLPAPGPSTAAAIAAFAGVDTFGHSATLATCAAVTSAIQRASFPKTGLNGIMLAPLEDSALGSATVDQLLMCSAVCGLGLDTVPVQQSVTVEQLQACFLDVAALSCRLQKQLSARLVPIPTSDPLTPWTSRFLCKTPVRVLPPVSRDCLHREDVPQMPLTVLPL